MTPHAVPTPRTTPDRLAAVVECSIVIPLYNEAESVPQLYAALRAALNAMGRSYEIMLMDDGSTDGTLDAVAAIAAADPRVAHSVFAATSVRRRRWWRDSTTLAATS